MSFLRSAQSDASSGLGHCLRAARQSRGLTLKQVSERTGVAISTLSKVENHQMSLTYDKLVQISSGLEMDISELFHPALPDGQDRHSTRRSIARDGEGLVVITNAYHYCYQHTDLLGKGMVPIITEMRARTLDEFGPMMRHDGEEYFLVIEGEVEIHTEFYAPATLKVGESVYIDSTMLHAYLNVGQGPARAICVCSANLAALMEALKTISR